MAVMIRCREEGRGVCPMWGRDAEGRGRTDGVGHTSHKRGHCNAATRRCEVGGRLEWFGAGLVDVCSSSKTVTGRMSRH